MMTGFGGFGGGGITREDLAGITVGGSAGGRGLFDHDWPGFDEPAPSLEGVADVSEVRRYPFM
jgi:hypothetical protein